MSSRHSSAKPAASSASTAHGSQQAGVTSQIASDLVELNSAGRLSSAHPTTAASAHSQRAATQQAGNPNCPEEQAAAASVAKSATPVKAESKAECADAAFLSEVEQAILRSTVPVEVNETEEITVLGQRGLWANRAEVVNWKGVVPIDEYKINEDAQPEVITKRTEQRLEYVQELAIRYLRPPTPPPPGEIIIKQECNSLAPPAPPLIIRQQPARPDTPEPLVIREAPPQPPAQVCQKVITISGKRLPPPPRKVVIERLAPLPCKPQSVIVERWLPYSEVKRRVIYQRSCQPDSIQCKPRNVIVQWEAPHVDVKKEVKYLGVIKANPAEYVQRYGASLKLSKDLPEFVLEIKTPDGLTLAADAESQTAYELEGDLVAFKLVDLDREGLAEYRGQLSGLGIKYVGAEEASRLAAANTSLSGLGGDASRHSAAPSAHGTVRSVAGSLHSASAANASHTQLNDSAEYAAELDAGDSNGEDN